MQHSILNKVDHLLVGGGHAHVSLMAHLKKLAGEKSNILMVSQENYQYYSGMASGYLEGIYMENEIRFNLPERCKNHGIRFLKGKVTKIDSKNKKVWIDNKYEVSYNLLSLNIGSEMEKPMDEESHKNQMMIKPLSNLAHIRTWMLEAKNQGQWVIVGGGPAGIEIALSIKAGLKKLGKSEIDLLIIHKYDTILKDFPKKTRQKALKVLKSQGIQIEYKANITKTTEEALTINHDTKIPYDKMIYATGPRSPHLLMKSDLKVDQKGYLLVDGSLKSLSSDSVFGVGDCITFLDNPSIKKAGVYPVRQAPILCQNLVLQKLNKPLKTYKPQSDYLSIMSLGDRKGLLNYKKVSCYGKGAWRLKDTIDRKFIR